MKNKLFAPFLTLLVAAIVLFATLYWQYELIKIARILLIVIIATYIVGSVVQNKVNKFIEINEAEKKELEESEGAVIEKENPDAEDIASDEEEFSLPPLTGAMPGNDNEESFNEFRTRE